MARKFGATWWGKAWVSALEDHDLSDAGRLGRGRTYTRQQRVGLPEILPGSVRAEVTGKEEYVADLSIRLLPDESWDQLVGLIADRSAHSAALLSGELPSDLCSEAADIGIDLLPDASEVRFDCTCPDWGDPCKHSAALAYLVAESIDADPFVLLLLRGRGRSELMDAVRARRSNADGPSAGNLAGSGSATSPRSKRSGSRTPVVYGIKSTRALACKQPLNDAIPAAIAMPMMPGSPVALGAPAPIDSGLRLRELETLAADAALRATDALHQEGTLGLDLDVRADLARRAGDAVLIEAGRGAKPSAPVYSAGRAAETVLALSDRSGVDIETLLVHAIAWNQGGLAGLNVATTEWQPQPIDMEDARMAIGPRSRVNANSVSGNGMQLRLDKEGNWWRFRPDEELGWVLASGGFADPNELLGQESTQDR